MASSPLSFTMEDIYKAACRAVEEALARHKARGESVVVWEDGAVRVLSPEEIDSPYAVDNHGPVIPGCPSRVKGD